MITQKQIKLFEQKISKAEQQTRGTVFESAAIRARSFYIAKDWAGAASTLAQIPSCECLLEQLLEKLKGKSVYTTLRLMESGKCVNPYTALKGLLSLATHTCIELEKGNAPYALLLKRIHERIGSALLKLS